MASKMSPSGKLLFRDRTNGDIREEKIYGEGGLRWLYETKPGYLLERALLCRKPLSQVYGFYNDSAWSARRIPEFIKDYDIDMSLFEKPPEGFKSFNEFFIRRYKPGIRPFPKEESVLGAPAEGRYFAFDSISNGKFFPIKGQSLSLDVLLGSAELAARYEGGTGFVARLCPVDYHRYHFPDDGIAGPSQVIAGALHSVNPKALACRPAIFQENERVLTQFASKNFGNIAYLEVGAMCVGRMVQTYTAGSAVRRGDEKGYFCFGASTVVMLLEPGALKLDSDLKESTGKGIETYLRLGESLGRAG